MPFSMAAKKFCRHTGEFLIDDQARIAELRRGLGEKTVEIGALVSIKQSLAIAKQTADRGI